jgi:tellurite resistance protein
MHSIDGNSDEGEVIMAMTAAGAPGRLPTQGALSYLPVNLFGSVMGISGLSLAWELAQRAFGAPAFVAEAIGLLALILFGVIGISYLAKLVQYPHKVAEEFEHPVAGNFFGTITISILLLSAIVGRYSATLAEMVWITGTVSTPGLSFLILSRLLTQRQEAAHAVPAWLIPGVATLDVAVAGSTMPFAWAQEVNLLCLAIGGVLALVFFVMIMARLIHQEALPAGMRPSLMVLIAPFEVGFLAYVNFTQGIDRFAALLFYFGLFLFVVLFFKVFLRPAPFGPAWWAISFPMAALGNAALKYAMHAGAWPLKTVAAVLLAVLTVVLTALFVKTLAQLFSGSLLRG